MKIQYISYDGIVFDNEDECRGYEEEKQLSLLLDDDDYELYNEEGIELSINQLKEQVDEVYLVKANNLQAIKYFDDLSNKKGLFSPYENEDMWDSKVGKYYFYDRSTDLWKEIGCYISDELKYSFESIFPFNEVLKEEYEKAFAKFLRNI